MLSCFLREESTTSWISGFVFGLEKSWSWSYEVLERLCSRSVADKLGGGGLLGVLFGSCSERALFFALAETAMEDRGVLFGLYVPNIVSSTM